MTIDYHSEATMTVKYNSVSTFKLSHGSGNVNEQPGFSVLLTIVNSNGDCLYGKKSSLHSKYSMVILERKVHRHIKDILDKS